MIGIPSGWERRAAFWAKQRTTVWQWIQWEYLWYTCITDDRYEWTEVVDG